MESKFRRSFLAAAVFAMALASFPAAANDQKPPASVLKGAADEEGNTQGRVPFIPDTDPVFAGNQQGIKDLAKMIRGGYAQKPLIRLYERLYPRLYPFDHPFQPRPAVAVAGARRPESSSLWSFVGPINIPGRMTALVRHPSDPNTLYVGAADGGVWKTTDAGATWTSLSDGLHTLSIGSIAMNPKNPSEVWAGTGEGNFAVDNYPGGYLYHTTDGGATWTTVTHTMGDLRGLAVKPDTPSTLFAAGGYGIFRSTDSGTTWAPASGIPAGVGTEVLVDPSTPNNVYAALGNIRGSANNGLYKSTDGGASFSKLTGFPSTNLGRISVALAASQTSTLYAAIQDSSTFLLQGVYKSTDGGVTWTQLNGSPNFCTSQCWYDLEVAVDPANPDKVYLGGIDNYRSADGGKTWQQISIWYLDQSSPRYVHADQHALVATGPSEVWAGCDGGVSYSSSSGDTWSFRGKGMNTTQYYNIAMHPTKANWTLGGTQDNGTHLFSGGSSFAQVYGGDGGYCAISPSDPNVMYEEYVYLDINKSTNGGSTWIPSSTGIDSSDPVLFIAPFVMDPTNPNVLYAGTNRIYRTTNAASNWAPMVTNTWAGPVSAIAVGPSTGNVVFAGTNRAEVYRCTNPSDASPSFDYAASGLPSRSVTSFAIAPDEQTVYVTFSGTGTSHIFKSTDQGHTWNALTAGLPDEPFNTIVIHPADPKVLYAGSDFGVYASFDGGATWAPYGSGLPHVAVDSLAISGSQGLLQAGTHGRGVWQVAAQTTGNLQVQPTAVPASGGAPLNVTFTANTAGGTQPYTFAWSFGDSSTGTGQTATHTYTAVGSYTASVTVTDAASGTATGTVKVSVVVPPPTITGVSKMANPLRLKVTGTNFKAGATVKVNGTPAPTTTMKNASQLIAKGAALKTMVPKGTQVSITVANSDGGESSPFLFTR